MDGKTETRILEDGTRVERTENFYGTFIYEFFYPDNTSDSFTDSRDSSLPNDPTGPYDPSKTPKLPRKWGEALKAFKK